MCSELCKDFYVVYQLEMVAGEVESSCELVVTFFFFFFGLTLPNYRNKSGSAQRSPPSYQLLPPPLRTTLRVQPPCNGDATLKFHSLLFCFSYIQKGQHKLIKLHNSLLKKFSLEDTAVNFLTRKFNL